MCVCWPCSTIQRYMDLIFRCWRKMGKISQVSPWPITKWLCFYFACIVKSTAWEFGGIVWCDGMSSAQSTYWVFRTKAELRPHDVTRWALPETPSINFIWFWINFWLLFRFFFTIVKYFETLACNCIAPYGGCSLKNKNLCIVLLSTRLLLAW